MLNIELSSILSNKLIKVEYIIIKEIFLLKNIPYYKIFTLRYKG